MDGNHDCPFGGSVVELTATTVVCKRKCPSMDEVVIKTKIGEVFSVLILGNFGLWEESNGNGVGGVEENFET